MYSIKIKSFLKMGAHSGYGNYNVLLDIHLGKDTTPSQLQYGRKGKQEFNAGEALEAIFADEDSVVENFDCGLDIEYVQNSENESVSEERDLDDSIGLCNRSYSKSTEKFQNPLQVTFLIENSKILFHFSNNMSYSELEKCLLGCIEHDKHICTP